MSLIRLFFRDFIIIWLILEISNFLFICALNLSINNKKIIFFYFMIQIIASFIIIFSIIFNNIIFKNNFIILILIIALLIKLSIPPLHLWLPLIAKFIPWKILLILLTLQKIIPFYIISLIKLHPYILYIIIIICSILPPYIILNITNFKLLISYSSINQSSWIILLIYIKNIIWFKYFIFYSIISLRLFYIIYLSKISISLTYFKSHFKFNLLFIILIFNIAGLPPFSFFYIKWFRIFIFLKSSNILIIFIIIILSSLVILYIYINIIINSFFIDKIKSKLINLDFPIFNKSTLIYFITLFFSSIILII